MKDTTRFTCTNRVFDLKRSNSVRIGERQNHVNVPHVIAMVGLPARGKSYIATKLTRYLNWIGINTKVFNCGDYRRRATMDYMQDFFNPENKEGDALRERCALMALDDVMKWLENGGEVGVLDATNTTKARRKMIYNTVVKANKYKLFFVESICDDPKIVEGNIMEVKVNGPDYKDRKISDAYEDFRTRIRHYEMAYEPLDEKAENCYSFMKIFNAGERVLVHRHQGNLQSRVVYYLMNIHVLPRTIYLTRNGESDLNIQGRIGGDGDLTERGWQYSEALAQYIEKEQIPGLKVWTSWLKRTIQTVKSVDAPQERWKALNEINAGLCEEMTHEEVQEKYPDQVASRKEDKFHYRYPRGESYEDLVGRLEPVIMELERQENVLVVCHTAVARCLLAYFMDHKSDQLPYLKVPLHTVIKLTRVAYGCRVEYLNLNVEAVDTHQTNHKPT